MLTVFFLVATQAPANALSVPRPDLERLPLEGDATENPYTKSLNERTESGPISRPWCQRRRSSSPGNRSIVCRMPASIASTSDWLRS